MTTTATTQTAQNPHGQTQAATGGGLMAALQALHNVISPPPKTAMNRHDQYRYATELSWYGTVGTQLPAFGLVLTFSVLDVADIGQTMSGKERLVRVKVAATLTHTPSGESITITCYGEGADMRDKALYKALTGAKKYGYALLFALPTTDDPEAESVFDEGAMQAAARDWRHAMEPVPREKAITTHPQPQPQQQPQPQAQPQPQPAAPAAQQPEPASTQLPLAAQGHALDNALRSVQRAHTIAFLAAIWHGMSNTLSADLRTTLRNALVERTYEITKSKANDKGSVPTLLGQLNELEYLTEPERRTLVHLAQNPEAWQQQQK